MMRLANVHVVHFFLFEAESMPLDEMTGVFGPNGSGKSSFIDAVQIAMLGGNQNLLALNAQADDARSTRSVRSYCLGQFGELADQRARDVATTYITLIWRDDETKSVVSTGVCIHASADTEKHEVMGMYVLPDVELSLGDHLVSEAGVGRPREWRAFRAELIRRAGAQREDDIFYPTAKAYIRGMLARLRSEAGMPDHEAFQRAFRFALRMRFEKSVDQIVRDEVLEARPTKVTRFRQITESFRQLRDLVDRVGKQIKSGDDVLAQLEKAARHKTRAVTWSVLGLDAKAEQAQDRANRETSACREAEDALEKIQAQLSRHKDLLLQTSREYDNALALRDGHAAHKDSGALQHQAKTWADEATKHGVELVRMIREVASVLGSVSSAPQLAAQAQALMEAHRELRALAEADLVAADIEQVATQMRPAVRLVKSVFDALIQAEMGVQRAVVELTERRRVLEEGLSRAHQGKAPLSARVERLRIALRDNGVESVPVCDVVEVSDSKWQPVVEAFLGTSNLEAVVVSEHDERKAFQIYRELSGTGTVYGVKIVMPSRMKGTKSPSAGTVASVITGSDVVAVGYVQSLLGDIMQATSDAEALRGGRAMTTDGMLVGTRTMERLELPRQLRLGRKAEDYRADMSRDLKQLDVELARLQGEAKQGEILRNMVLSVPTEKNLIDGLQKRHGDALSARRQSDHSLRQLRELGSDEYRQLSEQVSETLKLLEQLRAEENRLAKSEGGAQQALNAQCVVAAQAVKEADEQQSVVRGARHEPNYDITYAEEQWDKLIVTYSASNYGEMIAECARRERGQQDEHNRAVVTGLGQLQKHVIEFDEQVDGATVTDWVRAKEWTNNRVQHLRNAELVDRQREMEDAYQASQETFRTDVAIALSNNLMWLDGTLDRLNNVLRSSPSFSNGERYRFKRNIRPANKQLLQFVKDVAAHGPSDDLLGGAGEIPEQFRTLLDEKITSGNGVVRNPLDDYREFFEFDIEIYRMDPETGGSKVVGHLSSRIGSGSGGEHRAPLYVIAGAALASAYRLDSSHRDGIRLILLDEAFYRMDATNASATMRYFEDLGLQVFLASPGEHFATLSAYLHRYYDIVRDVENNVISKEGHDVSHATRELMRSDLLEFHPELLDAEVSALTAETSAKLTTHLLHRTGDTEGPEKE